MIRAGGREHHAYAKWRSESKCQLSNQSVSHPISDSGRLRGGEPGHS
jgi:hypothetical protein